MADNRLIPFELHNTAGTLTDGDQVRLDASGFDGNLASTDDDVQKLAQKVDDLVITPGGGTPFDAGGLHINIPSRIPVNFDLAGSHTVRYRAYNVSAITSISLLVQYGATSQTFTLNIPTVDGAQSQTFSITSLPTDSDQTLVFFLLINSNVVEGGYQVQIDNLLSTEVVIDASGFDGNLATTDTNVQLLAQAVDDLVIPSGILPDVGGLHINIPARVPLNIDLTGSHTITFTAYNFSEITSLSLLLRIGATTQSFALTLPTADGDQSQSFSITTLDTSTKQTLVFALIVNSNLIEGGYEIQVEDIPATDVSIAQDGLNTVQADDAQQVANELERLFGLFNALQEQVQRNSRQTTIFNDNVIVTADNIDEYIDRNVIYGARNDKVVTFVLPPDSAIAANFPALIQLDHLGGTARFDTGADPTNRIDVTAPTGEEIRMDSETGTLLTEVRLFRGDIVTFTKEDSVSPWVAVRGAMDPRASVLPGGVFDLQTEGISFVLNSGGDYVITGLSGVIPAVGNAFEVTVSGIPEGSTFGRVIEVGDVVVAKISAPSLVFDENNDDWLLIRDAGHGVLTLSELRFLAQISESDDIELDRLVGIDSVDVVRVWLSPFILDHAPFLLPSTDPNNPQAGETESYLGGDEDVGTDNEFEHNANLPRRFVYILVNGTFDQLVINNAFFIIYDRNGDEVSRHNLGTEFRTITLPGSSETYYVFDDEAAADNFSSVNYIAGQTLDVVERKTNRRFNLSRSVNVGAAIRDGEISLSQLNATLQALINSNHALNVEQLSSITGFGINEQTRAIEGTDTFYAKLGSTGSTNFSDYHAWRQEDGLLPDYERTTSYFILLPRITVTTQLQKVEDNTQKQALTRAGTITTTSSSGEEQIWNAYTVTLPAITGANNPLNNAWQIDGTKNTSSLEIDFANLAPDVVNHINNPQSSYILPDNLDILNTHLDIDTSPEIEWNQIQPLYRNIDLTREAALLFDFNATIRDQDNLNEFEDIGGIDVVNSIAGVLRYYSDPNSASNVRLPGVKSFIQQDNIRFRNATDSTALSTSFRKVIFFDYAIANQLGEGNVFSLLRIGPAATEPLLNLTDRNGLVIRRGFADLPDETRTVKTRLPATQILWQALSGVNHLDPEVVTIPADATGSFTVRFEVGARGGATTTISSVSQQTQFHTFVITDVTTAQTSFPIRDYIWTTSIGIVTLRVNAAYAIVSGERQLTLTPTWGHTSGYFYFDLAAFYDRIEIVHTQNGYEDLPVNVGGTGSVPNLGGSVYRYDTMRANHRNRVGMIFKKASENDQDADPILSLILIINGEPLGDSDVNFEHEIDLHRRASDFSFTDLNFGSDESSQGRIQVYSYDAGVAIPNTADIIAFNRQVDNWLGAFTTVDFDHTSIRITGLQLDEDSLPSQDRLTEAMRFFSDHLTLPEQPLTGVWSALNPAPIFSGLTRRFALLFHENRVAFTGNVFNDVTGIDFGIPTGSSRYYIDPDLDVEYRFTRGAILCRESRC